MSKPYVSIPANGLKIPTIAQVMKLGCEFDRYEDGKLWYYIYWSEPHPNPPEPMKGWTVVESSVFEFPVPVDDAGAGAFVREMKALNLMRWIRKHIEFLTEAKKQEGREVTK